MKLNGKENKHVGVAMAHYADAKQNCDMLDGNIARMFVSDDIDDIIYNYLYAKFHISLIYHHCLKMYEEGEKSDAKRS